MLNSPMRRGFSVLPRVQGNIYGEKMSAPNNAKYVLIEAHSGLPNSEIFSALLLETSNTFTADQLFGTDTELQFRASGQRIFSDANNSLTIEGVTRTIFSINGTIEGSFRGGGLDVVNAIRGETLRADGDSGGINNTTGITSGTDTNSVTVASILRRTSGSSAGNNQWIKIFIGTTAFFIPVWD